MENLAAEVFNFIIFVQFYSPHLFHLVNFQVSKYLQSWREFPVKDY